MKTIRIRPKLNFHLLGTDSRHTLDSTRWYDARPATNQPGWKEDGLVFCPFHDPSISDASILLNRTDYEVARELTPFTLWTGPHSTEAMNLFPPGITFRLPDERELDDTLTVVEAWRKLDAWHIAWEACDWILNGYKVRVYDDGYGPAFISRDSMGINGIARARTWEDAYSICEDEFFPEADETVSELETEYTGDDGADWTENPLFQDAFGFRPNGANHTDKHGHGIYAKDLNGDALDTLTCQARKDLEISLYVQSTDHPWPVFESWSERLLARYEVK